MLETQQEDPVGGPGIMVKAGPGIMVKGVGGISDGIVRVK